ncbi:MAG: heme-binding domain-containing protein, partial [Anaerolineae bacterium]|nr:heme-binding domain-containing protein [Anaerolineae bacterium]
YVFPMATLIQNDVERGRAALNFSEWDSTHSDQAKTETVVETISKNQMPLPYYILLHPEAELTDIEKGQLINGLIATMSLDKNLEAGELDQPEK